MNTTVNQWLQAVSNVTGAIALVFLFLMMAGTTVDAIFRSVVGQSLPGLFEMAELSLVMVVFMGLGWTKLDDAHIRVTTGVALAKKWLPPMFGRALDSSAWLLAAVVLAALAWPATQEAVESVAIREFRWGYVEVPIWWAKIAVAFGLWFGALQMLLSSIQALVCRSTVTPEVSASFIAPH